MFSIGTERPASRQESAEEDMGVYRYGYPHPAQHPCSVSDGVHPVQTSDRQVRGQSWRLLHRSQINSELPDNMRAPAQISQDIAVCESCSNAHARYNSLRNISANSVAAHTLNRRRDRCGDDGHRSNCRDSARERLSSPAFEGELLAIFLDPFSIAETLQARCRPIFRTLGCKWR
jgi:hypothetical protein